MSFNELAGASVPGRRCPWAGGGRPPGAQVRPRIVDGSADSNKQ